MNDQGQVIVEHNGLHIWDVRTKTITPITGVRHKVTDINEFGQVIGVGIDANGSQSGVIWDQGQLTHIGSFGSVVSLSAINNYGHVAGQAYDPITGWRNIYWDGTALVDLGPGQGSAGINNHDQIVLKNNNGWVLWDHYNETVLSGLSGSAGFNAVNDFGVAVGWDAFFEDSPTNIHAISSSVPYDDPQDYGSLGSNYYTVFHSVNNRGWMVGRAWFSAQPDLGIIHKNSGLSKLDEFLPASSGWDSLINAIDVNSNGDVIGVGRRNGYLGYAFYMNSICLQ
jgi:hypothetical protein